ncbi:MAG: hypothetical protein GXP62_12715 [Oligoflexia bacterium]|nr:hypothetical protein [Oligoflexia bacterium]
MYTPAARIGPLLILALAVLSGCPDPSATTGMPKNAPPPAGQVGGGQAGAGPAAPGNKSETPATDWDTYDGDQVTISGTLSYDGSKTGALRLDFLGADTLGGLQHTMTVDALGPWTVKAPAKLGNVFIVGFVDVAKDGPSSDDPAARTADSITISDKDITGIDLKLVDDPDLGDLTPGGPHPGNADVPPTAPTGEGAIVPPADGPPAQSVRRLKVRSQSVRRLKVRSQSVRRLKVRRRSRCPRRPRTRPRVTKDRPTLRWMLGVVLAASIAVIGLILGDRALLKRVHTPGQLATLASQLDLDPDHHHAVILGTCLSAQHIVLDRLNAELPDPWKVDNLGAAATTPVEWYLAWKNRLPKDKIDTLIIAYGRFDLTEPTTPWESETLDLVGPGDMDDLVETACDTTECKLDLRLQKLSALWRYRPFLAGMFWHALGMAPPQDLRQARLRVVKGMHPTSSDPWTDANPSVVFLRRLVTQAQAEGSAVVLMPLPLRPDQAGAQQPQARKQLAAGIHDLTKSTGVVVLPTPDLDATLFDDDVHLKAAGVDAYTDWLGQKLPTYLKVRDTAK